MRLPVIGGDDSKIDETAAEKMMDYAMEHGINYYDTAWGYHGGQSELVIGRALKRYPRKATICRLSFLAMVFLIWIRSRKFLKNS